MQEFIINEVKKMFTKGLLRYKKELGGENVMLLMYLKAKDEEAYMIFKNGVFEREITLKEFLGIKVIDLKGYTTLVPPHIVRFLKEFVQEQGSEQVDVNVYLNEDEDDIRLFLYTKGELVRKLSLEQLIKL